MVHFCYHGCNLYKLLNHFRVFIVEKTVYLGSQVAVDERNLIKPSLVRAATATDGGIFLNERINSKPN